MNAKDDWLEFKEEYRPGYRSVVGTAYYDSSYKLVYFNDECSVEGGTCRVRPEELGTLIEWLTKLKKELGV